MRVAQQIEAEGCQHCDLLDAVIPTAGPRWVFEQHQGAGCPDDDGDDDGAA
jgi:hypothetical protein